jgi:GntR family transcriptional regulator
MELSREFNVSRITVARAINELASMDIVERRRGSGTRIKPIPLPTETPASMDGLMQNLFEMGKSTEVAVLEFGYVPPTPDVQSELQVGPKETVQRAVRVRSYKGHAFSYLTSFVPAGIGKHFSSEDLAARPILALIERAGVKVMSARQSFRAVLADPKAAAALDVEVGAPLLAITRTVYDENRRPVEFIRILYRPDRYQYRMSLSRDPKGGPQIWASKIEIPTL